MRGPVIGRRTLGEPLRLGRNRERQTSIPMPPRKYDPTHRVRVGIIGAGGFGHHVAEIIQRLPELELVGVGDVNRDSAQQLADDHGVPAWTGHEALLEKCECDAVAVVTPHSTHSEIAVAAAQAGRHIFCEKTMAITVAECHEMIDAASVAGVKLMVGHKRRLRPAYAEMKQLLDSGDFGRPHTIHVAGYFAPRQPGTWWNNRTLCGGMIYWAGVHDVDTIRYLMGEVASVHAVVGSKLHPEVTDQEESIALTLRFVSGAVGAMQVSALFPMATYRGSFSYQIVCEKGGIEYDPRQIAVNSQITGQACHRRQFDGYGHNIAYDREWSNFAAWVLRDEPPLLTGEDGLRCVEILQAAYIAAETGRSVDLPLDTAESRPFG